MALKERETTLAQGEPDLATKQQAFDQQQAQAQAQAHSQADQPRHDGGGFGGFQTCEQLCESGVQTPVKKGDPGYSRLFDLDGNNWACE